VRRQLDVRVQGSRVDMSFRAPVAIRDASASYTATVQFKRGEGCKGVGARRTTDRNYAAGALVRLSVTLPNCQGKVHGVVSYSSSGAQGGGSPGAPADPDNLTVGTFTTNTR
jgi:hypothetical protein